MGDLGSASILSGRMVCCPKWDCLYDVHHKGGTCSQRRQPYADRERDCSGLAMTSTLFESRDACSAWPTREARMAKAAAEEVQMPPTPGQRLL